MKQNILASIRTKQPELRLISKGLLVLVALLLVMRFVLLPLFADVLSLSRPELSFVIFLHLFYLIVSGWGYWLWAVLAGRKQPLKLATQTSVAIVASWELMFLILTSIFSNRLFQSMVGSLIILIGMSLLAIFWIRKFLALKPNLALQKFALVSVVTFICYFLFLKII